MSVLDSGTIDGMATDENGKALILLISDHLDWKNEYDLISVILKPSHFHP